MRSSSILALALLLPLLASPALGAPADDSRLIVQASEILAKIERGEPVEYDGVIVEGDLDLSGLDLPTKHVERTKDEIEDMDLNEEVKIVGSSIYIENSEIRGVVDLSNVEFQNAVSFWGTNFTEEAQFSESNFSFGFSSFGLAQFSSDVDFWGVQFSGVIDFLWAQFNGNADFSEVQFSGDADFREVQFNGDANFGEVQFSGDADFGEVQFNGDANFEDVQFSGYADFREAQFNGAANFQFAQFNGNAYFREAQFSGAADFEVANFIGDADFLCSQFSNNAKFSAAWFGNESIFMDAQFIGDAYFHMVSFRGKSYFTCAQFRGDAHFGGPKFPYIVDAGAWFYSDADFSKAQFSSGAYFGGTQFSSLLDLDGLDFKSLYIDWNSIEHPVCNYGPTYLKLVRNFNDLGQFGDADKCYYAYRKWNQGEKSFLSWSKYVDILAWITCGYGTRPSYTLGWSFILIFFFGIVFWASNGIYRIRIPYQKNANESTEKNWRFSSICFLALTKILCTLKKILAAPQIIRKLLSALLKIRLRTLRLLPGRIWNASFVTDLSLKDALYFSTMVFVSQPPHDWRPKEGWKYWVMLEDVLGWLLLALFLVTLGNVMIR